MTEDDARAFVKRAARVLRRWQREIDSTRDDAGDEAMSARDSVLGTLMEIGDEFPTLRVDVKQIAADHRYGT